MTRFNRPNAVHAMHLDTSTIAALDTDAVRAMDEATGGWPTSTPGAAPAEGGVQIDGRCDETVPNTIVKGFHVCNNPLPCPDHPTPALTIVERTAGHDRARHDLDEYNRLIRDIQPKLARLARLATAWGTRTIGKDGIRARLTEIDATAYCHNCRRYGLQNFHAPGRTECDLCADIRRDYNCPCPKELHDIKARRKLTHTDIVRVLNQLGIKWKMKNTKKAS